MEECSLIEHIIRQIRGMKIYKATIHKETLSTVGSPNTSYL